MSHPEPEREIQILIDGRVYSADPRENVLQAARRNGIQTIPTLCYHPALGSEGACRLCIVEVNREKPILKTACNLMVYEGLEIKTSTEAVLSSRKISLSLLLTRAPNSPALLELARGYDMEFPPKPIITEENSSSCILCGLCVKACAALGIEALQFLGKGQERRVAMIAREGQSSCIGCRVCEQLCQTQDILGEESNGVLKLEKWNLNLTMAACSSCGRYFTTHAALAYAKKKVPVVGKRIVFCPECKRESSIPTKLRTNL